MKLFQRIIVGAVLVLFSNVMSEVTVRIISPQPGERIDPCQNVTFVADVQTTEGEAIDRVYFYNRLKKSASFGYDRSAPWEREIEQITAGGNVKINKKDFTASCQVAKLLQSEQKIILTGKPKVWQGNNMITGEKITILFNQDKVMVEGEGEDRVEVILYPESNED